MSQVCRIKTEHFFCLIALRLLLARLFREFLHGASATAFIYRRLAIVNYQFDFEIINSLLKCNKNMIKRSKEQAGKLADSNETFGWLSRGCSAAAAAAFHRPAA